MKALMIQIMRKYVNENNLPCKTCKIELGEQSTPDFDRPLNKRGKRDAPFMGDILNEKKIKPALIISSPAKRAKKTAITIADKISYPKKQIVYKEELYEASINTIVKVLKKLDEKNNSVMIFGHNPGLHSS